MKAQYKSLKTARSHTQIKGEVISAFKSFDFDGNQKLDFGEFLTLSNTSESFACNSPRFKKMVNQEISALLISPDTKRLVANMGESLTIA